MFKTADLASGGFLRATNRQKPTLAHPTANTFDEEPWLSLISSATATDRDIELAVAAIYFGGQIRSLRRDFIGDSFISLSKRELIRLSIARANRAFGLIRRKFDASFKRSAAGEAVHFQGFAHRPIGGNRVQPEADADGVITALVDALPHWFAEAARRGEERSPGKLDFARLGTQAEAAFSLERAYRDLWQQVLWEPWKLTRDGTSFALLPKAPDDALRWHAWDLRQEGITSMPGVLDRMIGYNDPGKSVALPIETVVDARVEGRSVRIRTARPSAASAGARHADLGVAQQSYLARFLDVPLDDDCPAVTANILSTAWIVLHDLAECLLRQGFREGVTYPEIRLLSFGVPRTTLLATLRRCLATTPELAERVLARLTSDPSDLMNCFRAGVWHRPLIRLDEDELLLVAAPIAVGHPVRRIERWLKDSKLAERLSKTPPGILYEREVRDGCADALQANRLIKDGEVSRKGLKAAKKDGEEIDFLARVGSTVLVGEIKCFLVPVESSECYDHRRKLEESADQAARKARWLAEHQDALTSLLEGGVEDRDLTFQPIVILNQAVGSGETIGSTIVTDAHFLKIYLGSGSFSSGSVINRETGEFEPLFTTLYSSEALAEANLIPTLAAPPGLAVYAQAVRWKRMPIPTRDGVNFWAAMPCLDEAAMRSPQATMISKRFLAANKARALRNRDRRI